MYQLQKSFCIKVSGILLISLNVGKGRFGSPFSINLEENVVLLFRIQFWFSECLGFLLPYPLKLMKEGIEIVICVF